MSSKAPEKSPPPRRPTPAKPVVKRIGGGYSMKAATAAQPAMPKTSPLSKQTRPVSRCPCLVCSQPCLLPASRAPAWHFVLMLISSHREGKGAYWSMSSPSTVTATWRLFVKRCLTHAQKDVGQGIRSV